MKKVLQSIFLIGITAAFIYFQWDGINNGVRFLSSEYFPCKFPISYSVGTFDTKFGISRTDFLAELKQAEDIWEKPVGLNLFEYKDNGALKINLIYDYRQSSTEKLNKLGIVVNGTKSSYDEVKAKYDSLKSSYQKDKVNYEARLAAYKKRQQTYNEEVAYWNARRGAPEGEFEKLQTEKEALRQESNELSKLQNSLNSKVDDINALVGSMNTLARELNLNVATFNKIDETRGEEFEEGLYKSGPEGQSIDIFQYESKTKLLRVLAHEFGHALGLDHLDDTKAIMYKLNQGTTEKLAASDIAALKLLCRVN